jgi:hypothetical protein
MDRISLQKAWVLLRVTLTGEEPDSPSRPGWQPQPGASSIPPTEERGLEDLATQPQEKHTTSFVSPFLSE